LVVFYFFIVIGVVAAIGGILYRVDGNTKLCRCGDLPSTNNSIFEKNAFERIVPEVRDTSISIPQEEAQEELSSSTSDENPFASKNRGTY
jgi:hypothetical protein